VHLGVQAAQVAQITPLPAELLEEEPSQRELEQHPLVHGLAQHAAQELQQSRGVGDGGVAGRARVELALRRGCKEAILRVMCRGRGGWMSGTQDTDRVLRR